MERALRDIHIGRTADGRLDIESLNNLGVEDLMDWIRRRLQGDDPYYPLHQGHDQDPAAVFDTAARRSKSDVFYSRLQSAITALVCEQAALLQTNDSEDNRELLYRFIRLLETTNHRDSRIHRISDRDYFNDLKQLAQSGALEDKYAGKRDLQLRLLIALAVIQDDEELQKSMDFWKSKFATRMYAGPAFHAISRYKPLYAVALIPEFLSAHIEHPDKVSADLPLRFLHRFIMKNEDHCHKWQLSIDSAFRDKEGTPELQKFLEIAQRYRIPVPALPKPLACVPDDDMHQLGTSALMNQKREYKESFYLPQQAEVDAHCKKMSA